MSEPKPGSSLHSDFSRSNSAEYVAARWCMLPPHVREAICTLVDAALTTRQAGPETTARSN